MKVIISGGGTGGHVFPAIAIADAIKKKDPKTEILFVGAIGKLEMEKVPSAGYQIKGLDIAGFHRKLTLKNLLFPFKLMKSMVGAWKIVKQFKPDVAIGVGGYASGPTLKAASWLGVTTMIQEQNSYAGVTNKMLGAKAKKIFVAYKGMDKFFEKSKIVLTGNPVRQDIIDCNISIQQARTKLGIDPDKSTILVVGGSLGARTINEAILANISAIKDRDDVQIVWQVGKLYFDALAQNESIKLSNLKMIPFIEDMAVAYKAADVMVCRAGALTIAELELLNKPAILVPSPNVAEDHQTHNAMALVSIDAALMVKDVEAKASLVPQMLALMDDKELQNRLHHNLKAIAKENAATRIAEEILNNKN